MRLHMQHRRTLMRSAILMEREAETWSDGWSVNGHWDEEGQWAKAHYDDLMKHAMHLLLHGLLIFIRKERNIHLLCMTQIRSLQVGHIFIGY